MEILLGRSVEIFLFPFSSGWFWLIDIENINLEELAIARSVLNEEDLKKSSRLKFEKDRNRSVVIHALLKIYIAKILDASVKSIKFLHNRFGKPCLPDSLLYFNLSHSNNYAFIGIHPSKDIGVDIEKIDDKNALETFDNFLYPNEKEWLSAHSHPKEGFYTLWCAKEAYLKALGSGFSTHPLPMLKPASTHPQKNHPIEKIEHFFTPSEEFVISDHKYEAYVYDKVINDYKLAVCII
ncbi:4'-phosphopantetheinyl transferase superfamily protein [Candidatus Rhabdochlamydia sp. T3358]|uniref:4'-phosphopantetheinyl transferase family protein n=1 Tax=Candidatus Rhabdochlamydia sp. T3358 TaxID=2099795 RepID=UPI0010BB79CD|nr:4'-phosphopantetheinyl transferase superfamily protein [Candidatus Rhabdochlamydia sp. T3358]VHO00660.1 4'-phosphopantetheinyl transferase sfp [Candidatus Rhabdochlamydia sp. T3358]